MTTSLTDDLRIRGEFTPDPAVCRFVVSRPVFEDDWTFQFRSPADAPGSPLIEALFGVEGVSDVKIHQDTFTITKNSPDPWPKLAGRLIPVLKEQLLSAGPILDAERREAMKTAPLDADVPRIIQELLEQNINPALSSHGGWVKLRRIDGQDVYVEMGGGCQGCASSRATMKFGIERAIKEAVPQVRNVIDATDHEAGTNPYYR
ncbi:MAG: NifU family protein [Verrucomicrobia bacterium]|nr:NifU family protein [Verrucomicrobiota bacterium]MCH8527808.1 NifU family protein [Kiritimatiellia bacterium]